MWSFVRGMKLSHAQKQHSYHFLPEKIGKIKGHSSHTNFRIFGGFIHQNDVKTSEKENYILLNLQNQKYNLKCFNRAIGDDTRSLNLSMNPE